MHQYPNPDAPRLSASNELTKMHTKLVIVYCGFLLALSAFSIDIMLPVFGGIGDGLNASAEAVKMTVPFYLFAFGIGQMLFGPLSDRAGRKTALFSGLCAYLGGGIICIAAPSIEVLLVGRFLQGFGGATGHVIGRAVIRDLFSGRELARNMALATAVFSFGPIFAPLLGYALGELIGWRGVFWAMLAFGAAMFFIAAVFLPETSPARNPDAMRWRSLRQSANRFMACAQSRHFMLLGGWITMAMHVYLANAAQLYEDNFDITGLSFAALFALTGVGIIIGQTANRALIDKVGIINSARAAAALLTLTCVAMLIFHIGQWLNVFVFTALMFLFLVGFLAIVSNAVSMALEPHGDMAGFASSITGCGMMLIGSGGAALLTLLTSGAMLPWAAAMFIISGSTLFVLSQRKYSGK